MWFDEAVFYQIYPLGFCGAPHENDGQLAPRIARVAEWIPHFKQLGIDAVYFCPVFQSDRHGYDTRDSGRLIADWVRTRTSGMFVRSYMRMGFALYLTACLITWGEGSGRFRMC